MLANTLVHDILPSAITVAEDVSGYPGERRKKKRRVCVCLCVIGQGQRRAVQGVDLEPCFVVVFVAFVVVPDFSFFSFFFLDSFAPLPQTLISSHLQTLLQSHLSARGGRWDWL